MPRSEQKINGKQDEKKKDITDVKQVDMVWQLPSEHMKHEKNKRKQNRKVDEIC